MTESIQDNGTTFPLLGPDEHDAVSVECRKRLRAYAVELADDAGLTGAERFGSLTTMIPVSPALDDLYAFAFSPGGMRMILALSLALGGVAAADQPAILNRYVAFDGFNLALSVMGHQKRFTIEQIDAELARRSLAAALPPETTNTNTTTTEGKD